MGLPSAGEPPSLPGMTTPVLSSDPFPALLPIVGETSSMEKVDPNSASAEVIETLPGVGPKLAQEIVRYREERGPFRKAEDLLSVKGMGPKKLSQIEPYLIIRPHDK